MNLKKSLKIANKTNKSGQAIVEYILIFAVLAAMIVVVFGGFNPDKLNPVSGKGLTGVFQDSVNKAVDRIRGPWN